MNVSFRARLFLIIGAAFGSLALVILGGALISSEQERALVDVENRLVPRVELGPLMSSDFERLGRSMQDAVAAQDPSTLNGSAQIKDTLLARLDKARSAVGERDAAVLRRAIQDYYDTALDVSQRMLRSETGEVLVRDIGRMQAKQRKVEQIISASIKLERSELAGGFADVRSANERADRFRLAISLVGLVVVIVLSLWVSRSVLRSLGHLSTGLARFATGDFTKPIPVTSGDDLGRLAGEANQMASSLHHLAEARDRDDWLKAGRAGLLTPLAGELSPAEAADRALGFLARRIRAVAGTLYLQRDSGELTVASHFARSATGVPGVREASAEDSPRFAPGEGLLGQAALEEQLLVVNDIPPGYVNVASGLGNAEPKSLLLLPLSSRGRTVGVAEFALFDECSDRTAEFLTSVRETLAMALEASMSRSALEEALAETRSQAERLVAQEEELRVNNRELRAQQEELRAANEELEAQREALRENNKKLEHARSELQQKAAELARVSEYKSRFLASMSHELRTPLNSMLLLSHLLGENEAGNLTPKQVEHCNTIRSAGEDLLELINQILDLAKIEAGREQVHWESVPLEHFVHFTRRRFTELAHDKGLELVVTSDAGLPSRIVTDTQRMERILTNLVGNAIKFTRAGSIAVRIRTGVSDELPQKRETLGSKIVAFVVTDTGDGIPSELQEKVFKPFEQIQARSGSRSGGTGLGLAIARESALLLGGELTLDSTPGKGSTFTCYIPDRKDQSIDALASFRGDAARDATVKLGAPDTGGAPLLLVIEDDPVLVEQLSGIIRARGFKELLARSGGEGLRLAHQAGVAGIVLDVRLPDLDGWAVMERLRSDSSTRNIPVHFVSAVDTPERGLALGAVGYLVKPVTHAELTDVVFKLTRSTEGALPKLLIVEDSEAEGESIAHLLANQAVEVRQARNGKQALAALEAESFGCMILDLGLPDIDGLSLLETIRERSPGKGPRVVIHTGRSLTRQETRQLEAYSQAVIVKDGRSGERLLEEVRLFIQHLREDLPGNGAEAPILLVPELSLSKTKILIAEDDMRTVYALSALLSGKGAEVLLAENGREALNVLAEHSDVHVVLMDIMMPEMDGYETMRKLRKDERFASLPVIALTAKAMKGERERCIAAGASDYLTKPVDSRRLLNTLKAWLERTEGVVEARGN